MQSSVLIVDDDPGFRGLARRMLAASGLSVAGEAGTVEQAIEAANRLKPDAVLVDVGLPDGSGMELARPLAGLRGEPRIVITSSDEDGAADSGGSSAARFAFVP